MQEETQKGWRPLSFGQAACDPIHGSGSEVMCLPDDPNRSLNVHMPSDEHERPYYHRSADHPPCEGIELRRWWI